MNRRFSIIVLASLIMGAWLLSSCSPSAMIAKRCFVVPKVTITPKEKGIDFDTIMVGNEKRRVLAWLVKAPAQDTNTVVMLFNGIGDGVSSWVSVQKLLYDAGISSLTFNYGDLRDTSLYPDNCISRFDDVKGDAKQLMTILKNRLPRHKLVCLGFSMGCGVLSDSYPDLDTSSICSIVLCSQFSSLRDWIVYHGKFPRWLQFLIPGGALNNVEGVQRIHKPLLIVHSKDDNVNPVSLADEVYGSANAPKYYEQLDGFKHNDIFKASVQYWSGIIRFIKEGKLLP
jgi:alpha-beta hydrolase superfamily lysophospholipase